MSSFVNPIIAGYLTDLNTDNEELGWDPDVNAAEIWLDYIKHGDIGFDYTEQQADEAIEYLKGRLW